MDLKNYYLRIELLKQHSRNRHLIEQLSRKPNPSKLEYELGKYIKEEKHVPHKAVKKEAIQLAPVAPVKKEEPSGVSRLKVIRNDREILYDELPRNLQITWDSTRDAYKEVRSLHEKLKLMENASPSDREPLITRITALEEQIRRGWASIDSYRPIEVTIDHRRITANRKFISVNLSKLRKGSSIKPDLQAELQKRYDELQANGIVMSITTTEELQKWGVKADGSTLRS